jgi:hypothetical protein
MRTVGVFKPVEECVNGTSDVGRLPGRTDHEHSGTLFPYDALIIVIIGAIE